LRQIPALASGVGVYRTADECMRARFFEVVFEDDISAVTRLQHWHRRRRLEQDDPSSFTLQLALQPHRFGGMRAEVGERDVGGEGLAQEDAAERLREDEEAVQRAVHSVVMHEPVAEVLARERGGQA
jgi:Mg-chelatase subunit ChlI